MVSISDIVVIALVVLFTVIGVVKGLLGKLIKPICAATSVFLAYQIASPISALFIDTSMYTSMVNSMGEKGAGAVLLVVSGIIIFAIIFTVLWILCKLLIKALEKGKIVKVLNRFLGGVFGLATGLIIATVYLLVVFGLSEAIPSVNTWFVQDLGINPEHFTISKVFLDGVIKLFKSLPNYGL